MEKINFRLVSLTAFILIAAFSRLIPHMPNFSPLGAIGLFGAAYFAKKQHAILIPILATWLSDLLINNVLYAQYFPTFTFFYEGFYWQYACYMLIAIIAWFLFKKEVTVRNVGIGILLSSALFFLVSNFGVWFSSKMYPQNLSGLLACYTAGIPYLKGTLLGNLCYSILLFGTFEILQYRVLSLRATPTKSYILNN